ncbi:MAG: helix-turn-helix transcriptional regulator [Magnetococcales bacterium]|nr:helix-turn-helix transcriptional regulator [Magnetococcales bacterium]
MTTTKKKRYTKMTQDGRSNTEMRHVRLYHWVLNSPAWKALKPGPRALFLALKMRFNGSNNGRIGFSIREAAEELGCSETTAHHYFRLLEHAGFIEATERGSFGNTLLATEWLVTDEPGPNGDLPKKTFMKTQNPVSKSGTAVSKSDTDGIRF